MKYSTWDKFFLGFFILAVFSGIYLIFQKDYVSGISGSITGLFLIYLQMNNAKSKKEN